MTFPDVVVASVQMEPQVGRKADNVARSIERIEQAAAQGASIVVLTELANSGYVFESREEAFALAEEAPDGPTTRAWADVARRCNVHIVAGIAERDGTRLYNAAVVVGPQGWLGTYRKLHLWGDEHLFFEPGDKGVPVFHTVHGRVGVLVCYDGWFPEMYRLLSAQGADIVCMPTNWVPMPGQPAGQPAMATTLAMASAHSNGLAVVCANRIGTERGQPFVGQSVIVGPPTGCDVIFFQVSQELQGSTSWSASAVEATLVALSDYESPTTLKLLLDTSAHGVITRPFRSSGVLSTLVLARSSRGYQERLQSKVNKLEETIRSRRHIEKAVRLLTETQNLSETKAYEHMRSRATALRVTVAEVATMVVEAHEAMEKLGLGRAPGA